MPMRRRWHWLATTVLAIAIGVAVFVMRDAGPVGVERQASSVERQASSVERHAPDARRSPEIGFRTPALLQQHYAKHGREFGSITAEDYLAEAQALRDAPLSGNVLEIVRKDGVISRFDRASGSFIAFNQDGTIRTFFRPNDGERYFRRQASRSH